VTSGGETVSFSAGALDTGTGVDRVYFNFDHGWLGQTGLESSVLLSDATDSFADGVSAASVYFDPSTAAGIYSITSAIVYDKAGNFCQYLPAQLAALGMGTSFTVADHNFEQLPHIVPNDFNGDGHSDILWRNDNGNFTDWLGTSNGGFTPNASNVLSNVPSDWQIAGTGDFNGDGRVDVLWHNADGRITDWLGTASGGFSDNVANAYNGVSTDWQIAATGDFNGDGRADILWRNADGRITDWLGTPNGGFAPNSGNFYTSVGTNWQIAGSGDFNGDGYSDIMWRSTDGRITNWLGTASGGFTDNVANAYNGVSLDWHVAGIGDFNGDGRDDILWLNSDGRVTDWLSTANGGYAPNSANFYTSLGTNWHVAAIGDFNADSVDDILWRNNAGQITNWLGTASGAFTDNAANALNSVDTHWHVTAESQGFF
jgi:hypothetical protein